MNPTLGILNLQILPQTFPSFLRLNYLGYMMHLHLYNNYNELVNFKETKTMIILGEWHFPSSYNEENMLKMGENWKFLFHFRTGFCIKVYLDLTWRHLVPYKTCSSLIGVLLRHFSVSFQAWEYLTDIFLLIYGLFVF